MFTYTVCVQCSPDYISWLHLMIAAINFQMTQSIHLHITASAKDEYEKSCDLLWGLEKYVMQISSNCNNKRRFERQQTGNAHSVSGNSWVCRCEL